MISGTFVAVAIVLILISFVIQPISILLVAVCFSYAYMNVGPGDPEKVLMEFAEALLDRDETRARALGSDVMDGWVEMLFTSIPETSANPFQEIFNQVETVECAIQERNQAASCRVCLENDSNCQDVLLIVENEKWVVHADKEAPPRPN